LIDPSIFTSQFQSVIFQLVLKLFERYTSTGNSKSSGEQLTTSGGEQLAMAGGKKSGFESLIQEASARYHVDPQLVKAVIQAESAYNPKAISSAGAEGLMQLMPATAAGLGVADPLDPAQNIDGGVRLLHQLLNRYDNNVSLALAAYNAGPGAVNRYGGIPPYRETQVYVNRVLKYMESENWSMES
jgi:soluble lytic murein transglycosylase-like protein